MSGEDRVKGGVSLTPTQKLRAAQQLRDSAWQLKAAWLRLKYPEWLEEEIQEAVREAFSYARD